MASTKTKTTAEGQQGQVSAAVAAFKAMEGKETLKLENTSKRDFLIELEKKYQQEWEEAKLFETNAPSSEDASLQDLSGEELRKKYPKFFGTFPYPYMNGSLHLGHGFTISKIEFATGFERMLGKRALFPVGFHCTGMPIKAAADKLVREMELFGPDFESYRDPDEAEINGASEIPVSTQPASKADASAPTTSTSTSNYDKSKKSKVNAKSTGLTYQFQIMEAIGIPRAEIKKFANPLYWVSYFPPIARADLTAMGARVDWRRSFITTDANPYYDSFVRWQINKLREMGYIKYGKRHTIYSPKDGQPCMDHDRASGEAVGPQEYTGLKMKVLEWSDKAKDLGQKLGGKQVFMIAATLRTETTYAQINAWVGTNITYGLYEARDGESVYLVTERAARNMAFQDILKESGKWPKLAEIKGSDLIGTKVAPPYSVTPEVYVLPMENVSPTKGTGVVTSCPSDSPDDYATYMDLKKKPEYYKIDPAWVSLEIQPVLETPKYGKFTAIELCKELKINSQKDIKQLAEAKEIAYKEGFYSGTMVVGKYTGMSVQEAKPKVRQDLFDDNLAFDYQEPMSLVMSRSGDECVVALEDQWYLDYGNEEWKPKAEKLLARMETYQKETRHAFEGVLNWLRQWACARAFGLGTRVPFDKTQLVESLSDSTIYMAYYTIAHLLQGGTINGSEIGPAGIKAEDLTDELWDYIYGRGDYPSHASVSKEQVDRLRREFEYFYPMDIRSSGKDLIPNHLTFCIYVHAAMFPEDKWPLSMRANGHLLLNSKKMSKSTGNFLTLKDSVHKFGADATRLALAYAGDGIEDANFDEEVANANILRLFKLTEWCREQVTSKSSTRTGDKNFWDVAFESECNSLLQKTKQCYVEACYKDALKFGFFELQRARDEYIVAVESEGVHNDLMLWWIRIQALAVAPVAPHYAEWVWNEALGEKSSVQTARFPEPSAPVNQSALDAVTYVKNLVVAMRQSELSFAKKKAKGKGAGGFDPAKPKAVRLFIAKDFPEWQTQCIEGLREVYNTSTGALDNAKLKEILGSRGVLKEKRAMPFCVMFAKKLQAGEASFDRATTFDETETINTVFTYIKNQLKLEQLEVIPSEVGLKKAQELGAEGTAQGYDAKIIESAEPGSPSPIYYNV